MRDSCKSKITGLELRRFDEIQSIREVTNAWATRKKALMRYKCTNCLNWHVVDENPLEIDIVNNCTKCFTSSKKLKQTYMNSEEAGKAGSKLTVNLGIFHRTYPCPYGFGWHVTSEQQKNYEYKVELTEESIKNNSDSKQTLNRNNIDLREKLAESKKVDTTVTSNKKEWAKISNGLKNNRTGVFISFSITLRDLIPCPGYTVNSDIVKFIKDSDIENP